MALIKKFNIKSYKNNETILDLKNITVFYNKRQILNNLNLKINHKEILGILGPNGVGKSTIFNLITGLKDPNYGEIIINGVNATKLPINERFTKFKLKRNEAVRKFVFSRTLQLWHSDGLTFEFLFNIAKELDENDEMMLIGGGQKGKEPLIFQNNGLPWRGFLEGRIQGDSYALLLRLSNLELKSLNS